MEKAVQSFYDLYFKSPGWVQATILIALLCVAGVFLFYRVRDRFKIKQLKVERDDLRVQLQVRDLYVKGIETKVISLQDTCDRQRGQIDDLNAQRGSLSEQLKQAVAREEKVKSEWAKCENDLIDLQRRFEAFQTVDADVWTTATIGHGPVPEFVPRGDRQTRFVTFLNLKGGVGKTTLVANLGATYAVGVTGKRLRVLLVDLDYQGTLSNLCVSEQFLVDRRNPKNRHTSDVLLKDKDQPLTVEQVMAGLMAPVEGTDGHAKAVVASEYLDHIDFRQQARFVVERCELRFLHRKIFHDPYILQNFDLVFFDCPPRLTTSTVNALIASDFVVVPTGLHPNDVDAVPRTLRWLEKLETQPAFRARLVAIILNRTFRKGTVQDLTGEEKFLKAKLEGQINPFVLTGGAVLNHVVANSTEVARSVHPPVPLGARPEGRVLYGDVAKELYDRIAR